MPEYRTPIRELAESWAATLDGLGYTQELAFRFGSRLKANTYRRHRWKNGRATVLYVVTYTGRADLPERPTTSRTHASILKTTDKAVAMAWVRTLELAGYKRCQSKHKHIRPQQFRTFAFPSRGKDGKSYAVNYYPSDSLPRPTEPRRRGNCANGDGRKAHGLGLCKRCHAKWRYWNDPVYREAHKARKLAYYHAKKAEQEIRKAA